MKQFKARLITMFFILIGVAACVVYMTFDPQMTANLHALTAWSIVAVIGLLAAGMYFDGARLKHMAELAGEHITLLQATEVVFSNYFLALMTPGATGGPVAQVILLRQAGVPAGKAAALVMVRTLLSIFELVLLLPIVFYFDSGVVPWLPKKAIIMLMAIFPIGAVAAAWIVTTGGITKHLHSFMQRILGNRSRKVIQFSQEIRAAVLLLGRSSKEMITVLVQTLLSLLALYSIVPVLFSGMGATVPWGIVLGRLVLLNFLLYFAPTPGGTGAAEAGFIYLFGNMFPPSMVGIVVLLWRLFSEYIPFFIGFLCVLRVVGLNTIKDKMFTIGEGGNAG